MAEAGFYFTGGKREPDLAQCYFCHKELDGWEDDDDPWLIIFLIFLYIFRKEIMKIKFY